MLKIARRYKTSQLLNKYPLSMN